MLPGQNSGGNQNGALLAPGDALKGRTQGNLGFAKAHVAAEQAVHGHGALHVGLYLIDTAQLVLGLLKLKAAFKVPLPIAVLGEGEALLLHTLGVELYELLCDVLHRRPDPLLLLLPVRASKTAELYPGVLPWAYIF